MSKQTLGIIGSIVLFIGVFTPIISMPIVGSLNYFQNGRGDGVVIAVLAVVSIILTLARRYRGLLVTGFLSLGLLAFTFINFQWRISEVRSQMEKQMANNPFKGLGDLMFNSIQLQWGWAVLLVGSVILIVAGAMKEKAVTSDLPSGSVLGTGELPANDAASHSSGISILGGEPTHEAHGFWNNKILAAAIGSTILVGGVVYYFSNTQGAGKQSLFGQTTNQSTPTPTPKPNPQQKALQDALSVDVISKGFQPAAPMNGSFQDYITIKLTYTNRTAKDIRGFKGVTIFRDLFGDEIQRSELKEDAVLKAGQTITVSRTLNYNQFMDANIKLRNTTLENLKTEWQPDTIMFSDGTTLKTDSQ